MTELDALREQSQQAEQSMRDELLAARSEADAARQRQAGARRPPRSIWNSVGVF